MTIRCSRGFVQAYWWLFCYVWNRYFNWCVLHAPTCAHQYLQPRIKCDWMYSWQTRVTCAAAATWTLSTDRHARWMWCSDVWCATRPHDSLIVHQWTISDFTKFLVSVFFPYCRSSNQSMRCHCCFFRSVTIHPVFVLIQWVSRWTNRLAYPLVTNKVAIKCSFGLPKESCKRRSGVWMARWVLRLNSYSELATGEQMDHKFSSIQMRYVLRFVFRLFWIALKRWLVNFGEISTKRVHMRILDPSVTLAKWWNIVSKSYHHNDSTGDVIT